MTNKSVLRTALEKEFHNKVERYNNPYRLEVHCKYYGEQAYLIRHYEGYIDLLKNYMKSIKNRTIKKECRSCIREAKQKIRFLKGK